MLRFSVLMLAAFLLPFLIWHLVRLATQHDRVMPTGVLAVSGAMLGLVSVMVFTAFSISGTDRDGAYQPARLEDGQVQPGGFEERDDEGDPSQTTEPGR